MTAEWMPVNPCPCDRQLVAQMESTVDLLGNCRCQIQTGYVIAVIAQRKLLEYLIELNGIGAGDDPRYQDYLPKAFLRSMLKQLEAK
jgi:hypothetical protein